MSVSSFSDSCQCSPKCCVCREEFTAEGVHSPYILTCSHGVCQMCVKNLSLKKDSECPTCHRKLMLDPIFNLGLSEALIAESAESPVSAESSAEEERIICQGLPESAAEEEKVETGSGMRERRFRRRCLRITDLSPNVNEPVLYDIFSAIGPVAAVRMCRETAGCAYVKFCRAEDAIKALEQLNGHAVEGKPMTVAKAERKHWGMRWQMTEEQGQAVDGQAEGTHDPHRGMHMGRVVLVQELPDTVDADALGKAFAQVGTVVHTKVFLNHEGKKCGCVRFETKEAADAAVTAMNNKEICGGAVQVGHFNRHEGGHRGFWRHGHGDPEARARAIEEAENTFTCVAVKNVPEGSTAETVQNELFKSAEFVVVNCVVMTRTHLGGRGFGFGRHGCWHGRAGADQSTAQPEEPVQANLTDTFVLVKFETRDMAKRAVETLNGKVMHGNELVVKRAWPGTDKMMEWKQQHPDANMSDWWKRTVLVVKNLAPNVNDDMLRHEFTRFGSVLTAHVVVGCQGVSLGFGLVSFDDIEHAMNAIRMCHNRYVPTLVTDNTQVVTVCVAQRRFGGGGFGRRGGGCMWGRGMRGGRMRGELKSAPAPSSHQ